MGHSSPVVSVGGSPQRRPGARSWRDGRLRPLFTSHSLPVEAVVLGAVLLLWQAARIPFEVPLAQALEASRDWMRAEALLGLDVEGPVAAWVQSRPAVLDTANWMYSHMDETLVIGILMALRLVDPVRYPTARTAFALAHVPALAVVIGFPMAPPRWVPELAYSTVPPPDVATDLRNSTAAAVSLHVGMPFLAAIAAVWMRPRSPLAWSVALLPCLVLLVVLGTRHHFVLDAVVGVACALAGLGAARLLHGPVPRGTRAAAWPRIAAAAVSTAVLAGFATAILLRL